MHTFFQWLIRVVKCDMEYFEEETMLNQDSYETVKKTMRLKQEERKGETEE